MKKQKGAALIVVMSLLAISLMIGLMSMQTSRVDERLAGNYRASALAQMAAEQGASDRVSENNFNQDGDGVGCAELSDNYSDSDYLDKFSDFKSVIDHGSFVAGYYYAGCRDDGDDADLILGQVRQGAGGSVTDFFAIHFLAVVNRSAVEGLTINGSPPLLNPLVCLRSAEDGCGWEDGDVADFFDGRPHPVPVDFDCNGAGCRTSPEGSDATEVVYDEALWSVWNDYVESLISGFDPEEYNDFSQGERDEVEVIIVEGDVKHAANINTYGIIVVKGGSSLELSGTGHHEGLIIVKDGGVLRMRNNTNVYGAVVALGEITLEGWGNNPPRAGVRYSAISSGGAGRPGDFVWQIL